MLCTALALRVAAENPVGRAGPMDPSDDGTTTVPSDTAGTADTGEGDTGPPPEDCSGTTAHCGVYSG